MNHLEVRQTLTSLEVAEMVEKEHSHLLRDIRRYCKQMNEINENITFEGQSEINESKIGLVKTNESKIELVEFFIEDFYLDSKGEKRPCYNVTKKGCEFIAHKLTGTKGTVFTARYINRFHDMEQILKQSMQGIEEVAEAQTRLKKKSSWLTDMEENFKFLCKAYNFSRKTLYHHILVDVGKVYDIDEAKAVYAKEKGYEP